jgi:hypothetical protein
MSENLGHETKRRGRCEGKTVSLALDTELVKGCMAAWAERAEGDPMLESIKPTAAMVVGMVLRAGLAKLAETAGG